MGDGEKPRDGAVRRGARGDRPPRRGAPAVTLIRVVALSTLAAALVAGCGSHGESTVQSVNTLRFTRADGSRISFRGPVSVTCERAMAEKPPLLRVLVGRRTPEGRRPFWTLEVA